MNNCEFVDRLLKPLFGHLAAEIGELGRDSLPVVEARAHREAKVRHTVPDLVLQLSAD